jgi:hypothetical protein
MSLSCRPADAYSQVSHEAAGLAQSILVTGAGSLGLATLVSALYLAKSAAGINLLPGPSPLHDLLYHLVR